MTTTEKERQIWDFWIPDAGAQGIAFARGRLDTTDVLLVHAAPEQLNVEVRNDDGVVLARGQHLPRTADTPMTRFRRKGSAVTREDIWPTEAELGSVVMLAGGEVGILQSWWNDVQHQEWRWCLEFYNHR